MTNCFYAEKLRVERYETREQMGKAAAAQAAEAFIAAVREKGRINVIFAAAPSQNDFLAALVADARIPWGCIDAYHMDEYIGLPADAPQGFANFLRRGIFDLVPFHSVHCMNGQCEDGDAEAARYAELIRMNPPDVVCMGIGENGHIAFNDPHVADFHDPKLCKVVSLDEVCRTQQVHDGAFRSLEEVPTHAMSLTVPAMLSAKRIFCVVPCRTKAQAVRRTVHEAAGEACPATALRAHPNATLYLDRDSASLL